MIIKYKKLSAAIAAYTSLMAMSTTTFAQEADSEDKKKEAVQLEEIQVTGMRQSLENSVAIKKNTMEIVDSITAEDIGKLPDMNVADTLTRIPGVQGYRYGGETASPFGSGSGLTIRGLSNQTASRVDGRAYFTAGGREFNVESAIPGMISGIDVYKNPSAEHIEGGIGGLVDLKTRKPLDFDDLTVNVAVSSRYNDLSEDTSPEYFGLFANRWETGVGEMGLLVAANYQESHNRSDSNPTFGLGPGLRRAVRADSDEYAGLSGADQAYAGRSDVWYLDSVSCPGGGNYLDDPTCLPESERQGLVSTLGQFKQIFQEDINRVRKGGNIAFQWRPSETLELYATGNYNYYLYDQEYRFLVTFPTGRTVRGLTTADYNFDENFANRNSNGGANELVAGQILSGGTFLDKTYESWGGHEERPYETWIAAVGAEWQASDRLEAKFDLSIIQADQLRDNRRLVFNSRQDLTWDVSRDLSVDPHQINLDGPDLSDPDNFVFRQYDNGAHVYNDDEGIALQTDWKYQTDLSFIEDIKFGARYAAQEASYRSYSYGGRPLTTDGKPLAADQSNAILASSMPGVLDRSPGNWLDGEGGYNGGYVVYDPLEIGGNNVRNLFPQAGIRPEGDLEENLTSRRYSEEETLAAYAMADFAYGDILRGNVGVRVVQTDLYARAMIVNEADEIVPNDSRSSYTDVLPSLNVTGYIDEDTLVRFGYAKGISRPGLGALNPSVSVSAGRGTVNVGNPDLKPLEADSFDLSFEKYFSASNYVSLAVFYKDIDGFFNTKTSCETIEGWPAYGGGNGCSDGQYLVSRQVNAEKGSAKGWELGFQSFFDYDFMPQALHNFGVSGSYTDLDTKNPVQFGDSIVNVPMLVQSDTSWTLAALYENDFVSGRLVYTYRSPFANRLSSSPSGGFYTKGYGLLDASLNFEITEDLDLAINASNLTNQAPVRYVGEPRDHESDFLVQHFENGRVFGMGLRYSF